MVDQKFSSGDQGKMEKSLMKEEVILAKLAGGLARIDRTPEKIGLAFEESGQSISKFAIRHSAEVGSANSSSQVNQSAVRARELIQAGLVSPRDPIALALQEPLDKGLVEKIKTDKGYRDFVDKNTEKLRVLTTDRDSLTTLMAIRHQLKGSGQLPYGGIADAFGRIALSEARNGNSEAVRTAGFSLAHITESGCQIAAERIMETKAKTRKIATGREL